ncbi:DUF3604 domain-containing protein [Pseudomonas laurylsulfatiphila]|uniref:DUF3604 domain-containing protein n=1 Tax=Pseudomonas laurylsulfatiphila TaxID=2011015 RepID=UPI002160894C|nr:DUF3604 domain-containing protein [Pseudomonas laurylsulfatiphila]UVM02417.1 DUF3604 domain-containing protein [Pseudomonas laurylsulfatiphila]
MKNPTHLTTPSLLGCAVLTVSSLALAEGNPDREVYFGQTHSHSSWSIDAYLIGNHQVDPEQAYQYSLGMPVKHPMGFEVQLKGRPLDFHGVTDHSEYVGVIALANDPKSDFSKLPIAQKLMVKTPEDFNRVFKWIAGSLNNPIKELIDPKVAGNIWQQNIAIADKYYKPGKFTTFVAYEWTSAPNNQNMHRNVFFRDSKKVPDLPFTALDSNKPEDLWSWMDDQRKKGNEILAISHNANLSNGLMFPVDVDDRGRPIDAAWAEARMRNESLTEIHQVKGTSETHPELSPTDEFANYEIMSFLIGIDNSTSKLNGSYIRQAWQNGMAMQEARGYNPYKMGVVGASDSHNGVIPYSQSNNFGSHGFTDSTPATRLSGKQNSGMMALQTSTSGLAGVWAEENTRESIFDAMKRKEVYGTSGVRIPVRMFGGWGFDSSLWNEKDWVHAAYAKGVPMGGDLPAKPGKQAPSFVVWAVKDADDGNLDRIQIIKGWTKNGQTFEKIYDVAWAGDRQPDPVTGKVPAVGSTVDVSKATYTNTIGATELKKVWVDPDFDPAQHAFYYARALQIPTPRWSTYDAAKLQVPPPADVSPTVQERAWTSPIWYTPTAEDSKTVAGGKTIDQLKTEGAKALTNEQLQTFVVGKTIKVRNTVTGQTFEIVYGTDGQRLVASVDGKPPAEGEYLNMLHGGQFGVPAKYEIKDGHLVTTLGGTPFEATVFEQNGKYVAARSNEFGYVNYEVEAVK